MTPKFLSRVKYVFDSIKGHFEDHWPLYLILSLFLPGPIFMLHRLKKNGPQNAVVVSEGKCFMLRDVGYIAGYTEGKIYRKCGVLAGHSKDGYLNFSNFSASLFYHEEWQKAADSLGVRLEDCK